MTLNKDDLWELSLLPLPGWQHSAARDALLYINELEATLASLWLYVDWRYCTKQLTTPQKELWADVVDAAGEEGPVADRWWR